MLPLDEQHKKYNSRCVMNSTRESFVSVQGVKIPSQYPHHSLRWKNGCNKRIVSERIFTKENVSEIDYSRHMDFCIDERF